MSPVRAADESGRLPCSVSGRGLVLAPPQVSKMVFDPLHIVAESGRVGHGFYGGSHVRGRCLVAGLGFGLEGADDLAHLIGLEAASQEGEQG